MSFPAMARSSSRGSREPAPRPRSRGRFWEVGGGGGGGDDGGDRLERAAAAESERWELLLRRGELLALGGHLQGALEAYAAALRRGAPVRPELLGMLVDCLALKYRLRRGLGWGGAARAAGAGAGAGGLLSCPGCRGFLSEPVTVPCGHSYCRRCLRRGLRARCRLCRASLPPAAAADAEGTSPPRPPPPAAAIAASGLRTSVVLSHLAEKWFPSLQARARAAGRLAELLHEGRHREALAAAGEALRAEPSNLILKIYRAESYAGLGEFRAAIEDLNAVLFQLPNWPEVYFRKGKVLHDAGFLGDALQLFLQCLALDEDFAPAKLEVKKILFDLLSPENLKEGLKDSSWSSLPCTKNKPFGFPSVMEEFHSASELSPVQNEEIPEASAEPVKGSLNRARSAQAINSTEMPARGDGLKRVSSEPLLSVQVKGALLKRKLSLSEQDVIVNEDGRSKLKKQGEMPSEACTFSLTYGDIPEELIDVSDFECSLCMRLFFEPVTTPCGHSFCKNCLERCLDHTPYCPLCKESLKEYLADRRFCVTQLLEELIVKYLPDELSERKKIYDEETAELSHLTKNVPIFVCTIAYPTVPCPLHVFEPRYRLMIRRSIQTGTKQFGMCVSDTQNGFADYGCMLQIRNVHFLPDGRSVVDTVGGKRFKVLKRGMKDGYCTADIEYLEDVKVENEGELESLRQLHDLVYSQACSWFQNLRDRFRSQILQHFGSMPRREENLQATPNGPAWCWWLLAVLPVDPRYQLSVLSMKSLKERLTKIQHILTYFSRDQSK
ncbi:LON peptidase N-terminal domain and RING finger protein 1 isoform X2 [Pipistrellus kuhlii]|uniref:LON peptidase N-terminal domain and RING finger protein 1 n=1 Tax=Pipistrellus kuhlii TaxID=59472 RepID=A0A7J7ZK28_PIPKU|nr:LON peptidase N-terminal domain and RING finger protein 1 isoform X2 [Pipistrellus kuhlii]KAF6374448.1 LON peptidase N-terminal domain and ring finger 1 [Pipistrellus kuhlii]